MVDFLKWLLQADIRWKNALSALVALLSVGTVYLAARHSAWFREVAERGNSAVVASLAIVLLISFLTAWLVLSAAVSVVANRKSATNAMHLQGERLIQIRNTLGTLTDWQRSFVLRFITEDRMQINEWEVGGYKAIWGPELDVLCAKGIIIEHRRGVLEIVPEYWQYLQAFWDPATQKLS